MSPNLYGNFCIKVLSLSSVKYLLEINKLIQRASSVGTIPSKIFLHHRQQLPFLEHSGHEFHGPLWFEVGKSLTLHPDSKILICLQYKTYKWIHQKNSQQIHQYHELKDCPLLHIRQSLLQIYQVETQRHHAFLKWSSLE